MQITGMLYGARLLEHVEFPAAEILGRLVQGARDYEGAAGPSDDLTVMVIKVLGEPA